MASRIGALLNQKWRIGARHALYHWDGVWYHQLTQFPGALCDHQGYVLFRTAEEFQGCPRLKIEKDVNVAGHISDIPGYVLMPRDQWHTGTPESQLRIPIRRSRHLADPSVSIKHLPSGKDERPNVSTALHQQILEALRATPGKKARDLAAALGVDKRLINAALSGPLRGQVQQDATYRWYPTSGLGTDRTMVHDAVQVDTPLAHLSRYYLDCLGHDDQGGVSEFARSKFGDPDYAEVQSLPMIEDTAPGPFETEAGRRLLSIVQRDRNRQSLYLGYPVRLNHIRSKRGWEGYKIEPLLLFSFEETSDRHAVPTLTSEPPHFNFKALSGLGGGSDSSLIEEAIQLADELGLGKMGEEQPDLSDLLLRLREIRPDWDWQEQIDPYALSRGTPLADLDLKGIYNRAILVAAERSPYTRGLENELREFQSLREDAYRDTALGAWLNGQPLESPAPDQKPLIEVLELNSEQRQAVRQALSNSLTIVTGPPGTGKSQVVTSLLVNAAHQGMKVLFASKNNKAVDVVETRVNALGPRPILLRLGANQYQTRLSEYLTALLGATVSPDDVARHGTLESAQTQLHQRSHALAIALAATMALRNEVDRSEQVVEPVRRALGDAVFHRANTVVPQAVDHDIDQLRTAVTRAIRGKQNLLARLFWSILRNARFQQLAQTAAAVSPTADLLGVVPPGDVLHTSQDIDDWTAYAGLLTARSVQFASAAQYFGKLEELNAATSLEALTKEWRQVTEELIDNSEALWQSWLRLQPARLGQEQRKLLGNYSSLLQMISAANEQKRNAGQDVLRRYYELFPRIASILSCWAVTSLSVRGRVPFKANFFDLLVIDEASQCDIASVLPLLYRARRVVVIGDPMQLRHISTLSKHQDQHLLIKHGLLEEYPAWAYSVRSLFDLASGLCRSEDIVALRDHHRSHADIIEYSNTTFYDGRLRVATRYERLLSPSPNEPSVRWIDVRGNTVRPASGGALNDPEAQAIVSELHRLVNGGYRGTIGVVSPFRAQANRIRDLVNSHTSLAASLAKNEFLVDTVHKFQGDERDVMLFSPVVSSGAGERAFGFLRATPNLFNVAITRARAALIVVGDKTAAANADVVYLSRFVAYVETLGKDNAQAAEPKVADMGGEYPVVSNPDQVSDWERVFYRALYKAGIRPIPQYRVEKYVLDFALIAGERRLNIEVDGEMYHRNWDGELCRRDQMRNHRLMELGWDVARFWVYQVRDDLDACIRRIRDWQSGGEGRG